MKNIIFIAPPAAGKGTQSDNLVNKYDYIHISTGDLLRDEVSSKTELGKKIEEIMNDGGLVDDEIVTTLLKNKLGSIDKSFILDGYPRNINQAEILNNLLNELNKKIDVVLYLEMDERTALERALGRIVCSSCGRSYNKYIKNLMPIEENVCDTCKSSLISRSDDNEETFTSRFNSYVKNTKPLLDYYKELGILNIVDNSGSANETFEKIEGIIND